MLGGTILMWGVQSLLFTPTGVGMGIVSTLYLGSAFVLAGAVPHVLGSMAVRACRHSYLAVRGWGIALLLDLTLRGYVFGGFAEGPLQLIALITFPLGASVPIVLALTLDAVLAYSSGREERSSPVWIGLVVGAALIGVVGTAAQFLGRATLDFLLWSVTAGAGF